MSTPGDVIRVAVYPGPTGRIIVAPLYWGLARGYFDDLDLGIDLRTPADHPWHDIARGDSDLGLSFIDYCAWEKLYPSLKAVAVHEQWTPGRGMTSLLARTPLIDEGRLTADPSTLAGLRLGLLPGRADDHLVFHGALRQGGLTLDDVETVPTPHGSSARRTWLEAGKVDLIVGRRPASIAAEIETGEVRLWKSGSDIWPNMQARYWAANADSIQNRRDVIVRFLRGYLRGTAAVLAAYEEAAGGRLDGLEELSALTGEPVERLTSIKPVGYSATGAIDVDLLTGDVELMRAAGLFPTDLPLDEVLDLSLVPEAHAGS